MIDLSLRIELFTYNPKPNPKSEIFWVMPKENYLSWAIAAADTSSVAVCGSAKSCLIVK